jgi:hypothetical protein
MDAMCAWGLLAVEESGIGDGLAQHTSQRLIAFLTCGNAAAKAVCGQ